MEGPEEDLESGESRPTLVLRLLDEPFRERPADDLKRRVSRKAFSTSVLMARSSAVFP